ncbi:MAG: aminoacyl-tRNA hydrolase [Candidatus Moraniibacteriota bacterium]
MKIIIGLGNPGEKYQENRHNAGFIILDEIQKKLEFPNFEFSKKFNAFITEKEIGREKFILLKPQTFMNNSGSSVSAVLNFYKLSPRDLIIVNDDLDILVGKYKIALDSSARGHNGVQSIFNTLKTQAIKRVKIGVEKETGRASRRVTGKRFVLENFTPSEFEKVINLTDLIIQKIIR